MTRKVVFEGEIDEVDIKMFIGYTSITPYLYNTDISIEDLEALKYLTSLDPWKPHGKKTVRITIEELE